MLLERLQSRVKGGRPAYGISLRFFDPALIEMIGPDWDFVWIDTQHSVISRDRLASLVRACDVVGVSSFVRVQGQDPATLEAALDLACAGVIVPMIENEADAERCVAACKYPPLGNRSLGGRRILDRSGANYHATANQSQWLICQIESPQALSRAGDIAAVAGVDGLMLGPDDYAFRAGHPPGTAGAVAAVKRAQAELAAQSREKVQLRIGPPEPGDRAAGFALVSVGSDHEFVRGGSRKLSKQLRAGDGHTAG